MQQLLLLLKSDLYFNKYTLGEECLQRLGFTPEQYNDFEWSLPEALGFSDEEIECGQRLCMRHYDARRSSPY